MTEELVLQGNDADWQVLAGELVDGGARTRSRFNGRHGKGLGGASIVGAGDGECGVYCEVKGLVTRTPVF